MTLTRVLVAECLGTFWLVLGGCGTAVLAAAFPGLGVGFVGVALAFGLPVVTMVYALGHVTGGHFNPAVTLGLWSAGRFGPARVLPYWIAQVAGPILAASVLYPLSSGQPCIVLPAGFASNAPGAHSGTTPFG